MVEQDKPQMIIRRMHFACWITKNTDTYTQSVVYLLHFYGNKSYANVPSSNFIPTYIPVKLRTLITYS